MLFLFVLLMVPLQQMQQQDRIPFIFSEESRAEGAVIILEDGSQWRLMGQSGMLVFEEEETFPVVLLGQRGQFSALVYVKGEEIPVALLSGEPRYEEGFRTMLLYADAETRRLHLADGTVRRVIDTEATLDFRSDRITEFIITRDRRFAIELGTGRRIAVSPPVR